MEDRTFPILEGGGTIPWWLAEIVYERYAKDLPSSAGSQSLERIAERGGFSKKEIIKFIKNEDWGWKKV